MLAYKDAELRKRRAGDAERSHAFALERKSPVMFLLPRLHKDYHRPMTRPTRSNYAGLRAISPAI